VEFFAFDWITDANVWLSLVTLIALEIVLGIDNLVFITITTNRLPAARRALGRKVGLSLALGTRLILLAVLAWIVGLTQPLFTALGVAISWRDLILIAGGMFLLWKATTEIHAEVEGVEPEARPAKGPVSFGAVVTQAGMPPPSVSALMYGPGRAMT